jgi:methyl-accepting chemotaxis protein
VTQQNAALVEQNTAAAQSMVEQARSLEQLMSFFAIDEDEAHAKVAEHKEIKFAAKPVVSKNNAPAKKPAVVKPKIASPKAKVTSASSNGYHEGWEEF